MHKKFGKSVRHLATVVALLLVATIVSLVRDQGASAGPVAVPTVPQPRQNIVVFVPHADDDALSMGVFVQAQQRAGKNVTVVLYTDGSATGACGAVDGICNAPYRYRGDTVAKFIGLRDIEYRNAVRALGVPDDHITIYTPVGGPRIHDGQVTVAAMDTMLRYYNTQYPDATFFTMSWLDHHQDHRSAGIALRNLVTRGVITRDRALFTMARWYWAYDYPQRTDELTGDGYRQRTTQGYPIATQMQSCVGDTVCNDRLQKSLQAYGPCPDDQPTEEQCTGIGFTSVPDFLTVAKADPRIIVHSVDAGRYPTRVVVTGLSRRDGDGPRTDVSGVVVVPDYGRYGTDSTDAANSGYLTQTIVRAQNLRPFESGAARTTVTALDARRRPISSTKLAISADGSFHGSLRIPAGATALSFYTDATQGELPAVQVVPVQAQRIEFARHQRSLKIRGLTVTGFYGQRVVLRARPTVNGRPAARTATALRNGRALVGYGNTARTGWATLVGTLTGNQTWAVVTAAPRGVVPALGTPIRTRVAPATLVVHGSRSKVKARGGIVTLTGHVAGRSYGIGRSYLVPAKLRLYRQTGHGKATYVGSVTTQRGGAFATRVAARKGQTITYRVVARAHVYAANKKAGSTKVG